MTTLDALTELEWDRVFALVLRCESLSQEEAMALLQAEAVGEPVRRAVWIRLALGPAPIDPDSTHRE